MTGLCPNAPRCYPVAFPEVARLTQRAPWLQSDAEERVDRVADEPAVRGARVGEDRIGPAVDHGQGARGVEIIGEPLPDRAEHALSRWGRRGWRGRAGLSGGERRGGRRGQGGAPPA